MHLLAISATTLDETDAAVDLGQSAADIMALSFSDSDLSALAAAWRTSEDALPSLRLASLKRLRHPMSVDLYANVAAGARDWSLCAASAGSIIGATASSGLPRSHEARGIPRGRCRAMTGRT